jgi:hypothetical protein
MMNRKTMLGDPPAVHLTQHDLGRLDALLAGLSNASASLKFLRREVDRATVVAAEAEPFAKLGSRISSSTTKQASAAPEPWLPERRRRRASFDSHPDAGRRRLARPLLDGELYFCRVQ